MTGTTRTKTGCTTCRIRRVKCDERRPSCHRCTSTGRKCEGYNILPYSRQDLIQSTSSISERSSGPLPGHIDDATFHSAWEKRCFQFFRYKTAQGTNTLIDTRFWDRVVLQAAHSESAIKHGVLALSTYNQMLSADCNSYAKQRFLADQQYQLCLKYAQELLSSATDRDVEQVLITCILCIHYETVRGQSKASRQHMDNGRAIIRQYAYRFRQVSKRSDLAEAQQAFARLDAAGGSFTDRSTPYMSTLENFYDTAPFLTVWEFSDIYEARNCLFDLSRWLLLARHQMYYAWQAGEVERFTSYEAEKNIAMARLKQWHSHFEAMLSQMASRDEAVVLSLRMWHTALILLSEPDVIGLETRYDQYLDHFECLVGLGERIVELLSRCEHNNFSYDVGYTTPMFMAAHRCRDPRIRRRAINVLRAVPRQEGNFLSMPAADVIERLMQYEEGNQTVLTAADAPEDRRVRFISMEFDFDKGNIEAEFYTLPPGSTEFHVIHEHVHWAPTSG